MRFYQYLFLLKSIAAKRTSPQKELQILFEFPVRSVSVELPGWVRTLKHDHWLRRGTYDAIKELAKDIAHVRDINTFVKRLDTAEYIEEAKIKSMNLGNGTAVVHSYHSWQIYH